MAQTMQSDDELITGINVTPLVDVVLVILIIFIMTASLIFRTEIPVDLPSAQTAEASTAGLLNVGITRDGTIYLNGKRGTLKQIPQAVASLRDKVSKKPIKAFVSADVTAQYGAFAQVMDHLRLAGIKDIALDTQPQDDVTADGKQEPTK